MPSQRLNWIFGLGDCHVSALLPGARHAQLLETTTLQAVLLRCFHGIRGSLTFAELQDKTGLSHPDYLAQLLNTLVGQAENSSPKKSKGNARTSDIMQVHRHRTQDSGNATPNTSAAIEGKFHSLDSFSILPNSEFQSDIGGVRRVKLRMPDFSSIAYSAGSVGGTNYERNSKSIEDERMYTVEATIVRCMKSRKAMRSQELEFVVQQMPNMFFVPTKEAIKKCVHSLENRDYLQRDTDDPELLMYVP